jgi:uncharacterized protein (AIM24 family)
MQPCYDGPPGTEGVGICKAGAQTCAADGMAWGACAGEVVPQTENCATPLDENCDGMAPPCKGSLLWAKRFGDMFSQTGRGIAVDGEGSVLIVGQFAGTVDFGGGPLQSAGGLDIFVAKLDASGAHVWSERFGDTADQYAEAIALDSAGNVLVTGSFYGDLDFGGGSLHGAGGEDVFIAKLDVNGGHVWSKSFGDAADQLAASIAVDGSDNVILAGSFNGTIEFGGGPLSSAGGADVFLAKLDASGGHVWSRRFGDTADQHAACVAVDGAANVFLTGDYNGTVDFGSGSLQSAGAGDVFVTKLDENAGPGWSKSFGDAQSGDVQIQIARGVATDAAGNVVVTGEFAGTVDFGKGPIQSAGGGDVFVVKLDADGGPVWSKHFGDAADQHAAGVALDGASNVLLAGSFNGALDFGDGPIQSAGGGDIFAGKLDSGGVSQWGKRFGDAKSQSARGIATDAAGKMLVIGSFAGSVDFGEGVSLSSAGGTDVFVAAFGP